jgi:hypothetical protein
LSVEHADRDFPALRGEDKVPGHEITRGDAPAGIGRRPDDNLAVAKLARHHPKSEPRHL